MSREIKFREIRIKLSLKKKEDGKHFIHHEFESDEMEKRFMELDRRRFLHVREEQEKSKQSKKRREGGKPVTAGNRICADDYAGEPEDPHAGIHLRFNGKDEIIWTTDDPVNFVVEVGPDPELVNLRTELEPKDQGGTLTRASLLDSKFNPFAKTTFPNFCSKGLDLHSSPLKTDDVTREQEFFKYQVSVLGTDIVLDPHIEGHDDPDEP